MKEWKVLFQIFWTFFKISPVTFGGGFAMIPLIEKEVVEKRKWLKSEEVTDVFALSQSVPGAVAINSATFIGHRISGGKGSHSGNDWRVITYFFYCSTPRCFVFFRTG